jgi:hypothetical protein
MNRIILTLLAGLASAGAVHSQNTILEAIPASVDFSRTLQQWDGFGFNYVEAAQTRDYEQYRQDYGGFSLLDDGEKQEILELVFGEKGLQVQIVKMFLDPYHQSDPGARFDHETTTAHMRSFVKGGLDLTRKRGDDLEIITTLYGPPAWATEQKFVGGRDLDPGQAENLGNYMANWVRYLVDKDYPVRYLSLHNEGEDFYRWDFREGTQRLEKFDFNMYWPPEQVNRFLKMMPGILEKNGVGHVNVTNGEPSNWTRFQQWGYTDGLVGDKEAMSNLGLLTTHGFINGDFRKLSFGSANALTRNRVAAIRPDLHSWITSYSWGAMGIDFMRMSYEHIYTVGVNALIPWAGIQNPSQWIGGDPNPGCALYVKDDGSFEVLKHYWFYKQLTRAGHRGMAVAHTMLASPQAFIIAFSGNKSGHPDAFVLTSNIFIWSLPIRIEVKGSTYQRFRAYRSSEDGSEQFRELGVFEVKGGAIVYDPPQGTITTFIGVE